MAESKSGRKKKTSAEHMARLADMVRENSQKKKKPVQVVFKRHPSTGMRIHTSKYRPGRKNIRPTATATGERPACLSPERTLEERELSGDISWDSEMCTEIDSDHDSICKSDALDNLIIETQMFLDNCKKKKVMSWKERKKNANICWESSRPKIFKAMVEMQTPGEALCSICEEVPALIRCFQCIGGHQNFCGSCDVDWHRMLPFHDREIFQAGYYEYVPSTMGLSNESQVITIKKSVPVYRKPKKCPSCDENNGFDPIFSDGQIIVITLRGRYDLNVVSSYKCRSCLVEIPSQATFESCIKTCFWPGTPTNICHLFHQDLFLYWDNLQKRMPGSSERSFLFGLQDFSLSRGRNGTINMPTFNRAFKEWKFGQYELTKLQGKNWMECPTCSLDQHSAHVDGNMRLYRFKSAGGRERPCYYGETFLASPTKVDSHIKELYQGGKKSQFTSRDSACGDTNWKAAGNTVRKRAKLDETGLEIQGCRHSVAQAAVSMYYGEIYGYAHYLQKETMIPKKVQFMWYDIICKYWPWLQKRDAETWSLMKPSLSVMHAKAHSWSCQVLWGGRWQTAAAGTTGEEVEQINGHFSRLGNSTKHMRPEGREELLTEHALAWNRWKIEQMPLLLARRYLKFKNQAEALEKKVKESLLGVGVVEENHFTVLPTWIDEVKLVAQEDQLLESRKQFLSECEKAYLCDKVVTQPTSPDERILLAYSMKLFPNFFKTVESRNAVHLNETTKQKLGDD